MRQKLTPEDSLPYKKYGKNHLKSSPNKHGCEKTNFKPHYYAIFEPYHYNADEKYYEYSGHVLVYCVNCGKRRPRNNEKGIAKGWAAKVVLFDDGYYEVVMNEEFTDFCKLRKMNWQNYK